MTLFVRGANRIPKPLGIVHSSWHTWLGTLQFVASQLGAFRVEHLEVS